MTRRIFACLLLAAMLVPGWALAQEPTATFAEAEIAVEGGETALLRVVLDAPAAETVTVLVHDRAENAYEITVPAGECEGTLALPAPYQAKGTRTAYTIKPGAGYAPGKNKTCEVLVRKAAAFSFSRDLIVTYATKDVNIRVNVANAVLLPEDTRIDVVDEHGTVYYTLPFVHKRTFYAFTLTTDDSWHPDKHLYVRVAGRDALEGELRVIAGRMGVLAISGVHREDRRIAYTIDCGSYASLTPGFLDVLDQYGVKITFFVTGRWAERNPEYVREMAARGHEIGNHTYNHPRLPELTDQQILREIQRTADLIEELTGARPVVFRAPYGDCGGRERAIVNAEGYPVIRWSTSAGDSGDPLPKDRVFRNATRDVGPGSIILSHIDSRGTLEALPDLLDWFIEQDLEVVKVSELLLQGDTTVGKDSWQTYAE